jgi:serine/threonine protein kinase
MVAVVDTALDVARAMVHLHGQNIVHSDLKARNVLLKGCALDPRGFTAKVADFGLSMHLDTNDTHISGAFQVGVGVWVFVCSVISLSPGPPGSS